MRKIWNQVQAEPWVYEMGLMAEQGMSEHEAKNFVIVKWMKAGDPRPLIAAIREEEMLRGPALWLLVQMLETGKLTFKKSRGRPDDPEAAARDQLIADAYEDFRKHDQEFLRDHGTNSDRLLGEFASWAGRSVESVRQAVTKRRKSKPKTKPK